MSRDKLTDEIGFGQAFEGDYEGVRTGWSGLQVCGRWRQVFAVHQRRGEEPPHPLKQPPSNTTTYSLSSKSGTVLHITYYVLEL